MPEETTKPPEPLQRGEKAFVAQKPPVQPQPDKPQLASKPDESKPSRPAEPEKKQPQE